MKNRYSILFLTIFALSFLFANGRVWTSADGSQKFSGGIVSYTPPSVTIIRSDGKKITFNETRLSDADRRYCRMAKKVLDTTFLDIPYRVFQVLGDGVLASERANNNTLGETFFIWGDYTDSAAEGIEYQNDLYWAGSYHYTTVKNKQTTIRSFALTLEDAIEIWELRSNPPKKPKKEGRIDGRATGTSSGTGFAITKNGHIVTNSHVIGAAESIRVFVDGKWTAAALIANDKKNDLAIIKINKPTLPLYLKEIEGPGLGDPMTVAGFPNPLIQGRSIKVTKGTLSGLKGMADDIRHFQIDAAVQPGNSGGPLLDSTGAVVGIVNARLNDAAVMKLTGSVPQNVNYAIKVDYLIPLIKTVKGLHQKLKGADAKDNLDLDELEQGSVLLIEATTSSKK